MLQWSSMTCVYTHKFAQGLASSYLNCLGVELGSAVAWINLGLLVLRNPKLCNKLARLISLSATAWIKPPGGLVKKPLWFNLGKWDKHLYNRVHIKFKFYSQLWTARRHVALSSTWTWVPSWSHPLALRLMWYERTWSNSSNKLKVDSALSFIMYSYQWDTLWVARTHSTMENL